MRYAAAQAINLSRSPFVAMARNTGGFSNSSCATSSVQAPAPSAASTSCTAAARDDAERGSLFEVHDHARIRRCAIWTLADPEGRGVLGPWWAPVSQVRRSL